jgi:hypothetical protein
LCALREALQTIDQHRAYDQTIHQAFVPLSIYRLWFRSRATCLCDVPVRLDRNDPDRTSW